MTDPHYKSGDGKTLSDWIEARLLTIDARLAAIQRETDLARTGMEHRLGTMNDIRDQLNEQARTFTTKTEHNGLCVEVDRLREEIQGLRESRAELAGKASQQSVADAKIMAAIGLLLAAVSIALRFV